MGAALTLKMAVMMPTEIRKTATRAHTYGAKHLGAMQGVDTQRNRETLNRSEATATHDAQCNLLAASVVTN